MTQQTKQPELGQRPRPSEAAVKTFWHAITIITVWLSCAAMVAATAAFAPETLIAVALPALIFALGATALLKT